MQDPLPCWGALQARQADDGAGGRQPSLLPSQRDAGEQHRDPGEVPRCAWAGLGWAGLGWGAGDDGQEASRYKPRFPSHSSLQPSHPFARRITHPFPAATKKMEERLEWVDKRSSRIWRGRLEARYWRYIKGSGGCCTTIGRAEVGVAYLSGRMEMLCCSERCLHRSVKGSWLRLQRLLCCGGA